MARGRTEVREQILDTAAELFYREGVRGVGVDRIAAESGVAKMTLYYHFGSKDDLVAAWLRHRRPDAEWMSWLEGAVDRRPGNRLLAVFDALSEWFEMTDFRGCAFINAHAELGTSNPAATEIVALHTRSLTEYLARLAQEEGATQPETLARELLLIVAGAIVAASIQGDGQAAHDARELATKVLAAYDLAT
jgi:AcrR family transcriptional regulator